MHVIPSQDIKQTPITLFKWQCTIVSNPQTFGVPQIEYKRN